MPNILDRAEFDRPGVYILKSLPNSENYDERIYIGEAENLKKRLKKHLADSKKDFYECVVFISKDEMLTKAHIKYLEARLISMAIDAKTAEVDNSKQPEPSTLPEADISDMEFFLDQVKLILPVVNFMFLVPSTVKSSESLTEKADSSSEAVVYYIKSKKFKARLIETDKGYVILSGSQCNKQVSKSISQGWVKLRNKLLDTGVLVDDGDCYIFKENAVFSSISAAAAVVLGRQAAGPIEWIDSGGKTYKQNQKEKFDHDIDET